MAEHVLQDTEIREVLRRDVLHEELVKKYLLENPHGSMVVLEPKEGLAGEQEEKLAGALAEMKAKMSQEEITGIHST